MHDIFYTHACDFDPTPWRMRWRARFFQKKAAPFVLSQPAFPVTFGDPNAGEKWLDCSMSRYGELLDRDQQDLWSQPVSSQPFWHDMHRFIWLDDLAALGHVQARRVACQWVKSWIERHEKGGAAWRVDIVAVRLLRLLGHGDFLLASKTFPQDLLWSSVAVQLAYLARYYRTALAGIPFLESMTGLLYAASLTKTDLPIADVLSDLDQFCKILNKAGGDIPTRNPEQVLYSLQLLNICHESLERLAHPSSQALQALRRHFASVLQGLSLADGGLPRFHGGGAGKGGMLEQALFSVMPLPENAQRTPMGYRRLKQGRTTVIVDADSPAIKEYSHEAHASTLGFELTYGRRPIVVSAGSGHFCGAKWQKAARATAMHSTLEYAKTSSSRLRRGSRSFASLESVPHIVVQKDETTKRGQFLTLSHDGYAEKYGVLHTRRLFLSHDGFEMRGQDFLVDEKDPQKKRKSRRINALHFHLHPDVQAYTAKEKNAIFLLLKSGDLWCFFTPNAIKIDLVPSFYIRDYTSSIQKNWQIVLHWKGVGENVAIRWTFSRLQDKGLLHSRDIEPDLLWNHNC